MSKKLPKEEQHYQLSKSYDFRDLEVSLDYKIKECELLQKQKKRLEEENAALRYDIKKYDKIFSNDEMEYGHTYIEDTKAGTLNNNIVKDVLKDK